MEILKKDNNVKRIYFISDIHIKNDSSYNDVYYSVFENLFKYYKEEQLNKDDLIVITGDIMDNGFAVSGNAIQMAKYLYINLANFCPVISILGNHDIKTNIDTLTPIVKDHLKTEHELYFLLEQKIYLYGQLAFGHTVMGSSEVINCKKFNKNYITISLYHGMLKGAKLENGIECRDNFLLSSFKDYKYCAFGDIHLQQFLRKNNTAFYTGSLIAQKISEDAFNHGTMKLDLDREKIEFVQIQNDYKKLDLILDDDGNVSNYDIDKIIKYTKYADLRLTFGNYSERNIENIKKKFEDNQIVITNFLQKPKMENLTFDTVLKIGDKELKLSSVMDRKSCEKFLLSYIESKHKIDNTERFTKNLGLLLDEIDFEGIMKKKRNIQFINVEMNNIMVYGKDVKFDISTMFGIIGMCENNSSGKSTLCEIISLILFGETPRCNNGFSFVRNGQKECYGIIRLISNGIEYEIKRMFTVHYKDDKKVNTTFVIKKYINKKKGHCIIYVKNDIFNRNLYKNEGVTFKADNEMKDIIVKEIITYDELYQMIVISQNREKAFLEEKDKDRDEILFKMANLSYLRDISDKSESLYKDTKKIGKSMLLLHCSKEFTKDYRSSFTSTQAYEHSKNILINFEKEIKEYEDNKKNKNKTLCEQYQNKNNELISLKERIKIYDEFKNIDEKYDIDELNEYNDDIKAHIDNTTKEIKEYDVDIKTKDKNIDEIKKKLKKYKDIEQKLNIFNDKKKKAVCELKKKILNINKNIIDVHYKNITTDENVTHNENKDKLNKEIQEISNKIAFYKEENNKTNTIDGIKKTIIEHDKYNHLFNQKYRLENTLEFIQEYGIYFKTDNITKKYMAAAGKDLNSKIDLLNKSMEDVKIIKDNYESLKINNNYDRIINDLEASIEDRKGQLHIIQNKIDDYMNEQGNIKLIEEIKILEKDLTDEEEKEYEEYDKWQDLIKKLNKHEKELSDIKYKRETALNKLNKENTKLKNNEDILFIINKNKDNYNKYCKLKKEQNKVKKEYDIIEKEYNASNEAIQMNDVKINDLKEKCIIAKDIIKKSGKSIDDLKDFELLVNILKTNGLCDKLLEEQIIVNLQKALDEICVYIGHDKIIVEFIHTPENESKKFNIIIRTDKIKDISNAGGFQRNIMELIFKVAFLRINSYLKSDFIIVDELFDACSESNKTMAIKLIEYYKTQYNKILLVSHNQSIINLFDGRLTIKHDNINGNNISQN